MTLECICGQVRLDAAKAPDFIFECNCSLCAKAGARWGYYQPDEVHVSGTTRGYRRTDKAAPFCDVHFCANCGATTHFTLTEESIAQHGNAVLGINMWLAAPDELKGIELRYPDGRNWSGVGEWGYVRAPTVL
jgi:hypothetical protein